LRFIFLYTIHEPFYYYPNSSIGGQREVSVASGRVDLLTKEYSLEI